MLFSDSRWFQAVFHETNRVLKISNNKWPVKSGGSAKIISGGVKSGGALFFWPRQTCQFFRASKRHGIRVLFTLNWPKTDHQLYGWCSLSVRYSIQWLMQFQRMTQFSAIDVVSKVDIVFRDWCKLLLFSVISVVSVIDVVFSGWCGFSGWCTFSGYYGFQRLMQFSAVNAVFSRWFGFSE